ncbi:hypothetical protein EN833_23320 [Mesorhizobium sp. M4B.F.Ca.ET.190.01.1.1]|uniref:hypothetical protein n=1 Tax=unclassified Mesorhizobium TaxID=325217 RepID=UPI0010925B5D|nr:MULTISPECIES: hypothetical protein [unclassified Mesorhizobium]TGR05405.1 hypothetical protein EN843_23310 [Mesorhizobium sp. M4B.F.Ca.ET.200.01.1.1]TGS15661.1 hypothetical protein EN833_23320 [Mesorhizobium sp. M4B.F.Ca.ET.190.01.1.1]TGT27721.1 hypothetical protein EN815_23295 [Mesorhizobium sp. M4B.F.Ca.ET.172.01.1.1]
MHTLTRRAALGAIASIPAIGGATALPLPPATDLSAEPALATIEDYAAAQFDGMDPGLFKELCAGLPSNDEWRRQLYAIRLSASLLRHSKAELVEIVSAMEGQMTTEGDETLAVHMLDGMMGTRDRLRGMADMVETALARFMSAAASA